MPCANDHYFFDPVQRAASWRFAKTGIAIPEEDKLSGGEIIYRIGHSDQPYFKGIAGAWWMRADTFHYLCTQASHVHPDARRDKAFRKLYRLKLAVAAKFGRSDTVIKARVLTPLRVWTGKGRHIQDNDSGPSPISWIGGEEIAQLCIPGLMIETAPGSGTWVKSPAYDRLLASDPAIPTYSWFNK